MPRAANEVPFPAPGVPPTKPKASPKREMGAGIAASPHLRRAKDPPVFVSLSDPEVVLLLDPGSPAQASLRRVDPNPKTGSSYFCGPSWTNLLSRRLRPEGHRVSRKKDWLFRRLFQLVRLETEVSPHRLSVEIGPSIPSSSFRSFPTLRGGWDFRPDHPFLMNSLPSRA